MPLWGPSYRDHSSHSCIDRNYMNDGYIERPYRSSNSHGRTFPSPRPSAFLQPSMSCGSVVCGPAGNMYGSGQESCSGHRRPRLSRAISSSNYAPGYCGTTGSYRSGGGGGGGYGNEYDTLDYRRQPYGGGSGGGVSGGGRRGRGGYDFPDHETPFY